MGVTISDDDFNFIYSAFERLMSPTASDEELSEAIKMVETMKSENLIWAVLQRIKGTASASERHPSPEEPQTSSETTSPDASPSPT